MVKAYAQRFVFNNEKRTGDPLGWFSYGGDDFTGYHLTQFPFDLVS